MKNIADIENITKSLNDNPMFRLSLGSKELFHSNFLEFLWEQNSTAFLEMLKEMVPSEEERINQLIESKDDLGMAREKEHFDICIYHNDGNKIVYDIIIENKVKSIPYKTQLDGYVKKIRKKKQQDKPIYILLSLAKIFPQISEIGKQWNVVNYDLLEQKIQNHSKDFTKENKEVANYIDDYCRLVTSLGQLNIEEILKSRKRRLQSGTYKLLKMIRLHDLYLKLKGSYSVGHIYKKIKKTIDLAHTTFGKEDRDDMGHDVFLSSSYNNGKCTITVAIRKEDVFYIVQIEGNPFDGKDGNQYRHMINKVNLAKDNLWKKGKGRSVVDAEKIKASLLNEQLHDAFSFVEFEKPFDVTTSLLSKEPNQDYCKYEPHVVYKYKSFNDSDFDKMINIMVKDVINTYKMLINNSNNL